MSKKLPYIWNRNLWQNNLNNETKTPTIFQPLNEQLDLSDYSSNTLSTTNIIERHVMTRGKFRNHNSVPNNREDVSTRNVNRTLNINLNSLQRDDVKHTGERKWKSCQNNHLHMQSKLYSTKVLNLQNSQRHQYLHNHLHYHPRHHQQQNPFDKANTHKSINAIAKPSSTHALYYQPPCQRYADVVTLKNDNKNHCLYHSNFNKLQLPAIASSDYSYSTQLAEYHPDSQLTWLPQVLQHQELFYSLFEVLPPVFLLKDTLPSKNTTLAALEKNSNLLPRNITRQQYAPAYANTVTPSTSFHTLPPRHLGHFNWNCGKIFKYSECVT